MKRKLSGLCVAVCALVGCYTTGAQMETQKAIHAEAKKAEAPVDVAITTDQQSGEVTASMVIMARKDVDNATARFVLPDGVRVVRGTVEEELGPLISGERRRVEVVLDVPDGKPCELAAGVDVMAEGGVTLNRSTVFALGPQAKAEEPALQLVDTPEGEPVRMDRP